MNQYDKIKKDFNLSEDERLELEYDTNELIKYHMEVHREFKTTGNKTKFSAHQRLGQRFFYVEGDLMLKENSSIITTFKELNFFEYMESLAKEKNGY